MRSVSILYILPSFSGTDHIFLFLICIILVFSCFVSHLCLLDGMLHILPTFNWLASAVLSLHIPRKDRFCWVTFWSDVWNHLWWLLLQEGGACENLFLLHHWRFCILLGTHDLAYKMAVQCIMSKVSILSIFFFFMYSTIQARPHKWSHDMPTPFCFWLTSEYARPAEILFLGFATIICLFVLLQDIWRVTENSRPLKKPDN